MLYYFDLSCTSKTTVALGERVAISRWVGLSLSRIRKRSGRVWRRGMHWMKMNKTSEYSCFQTRFLAPCCSVERSVRHSPAPCRLSLLWDRVSEHARYPSFSILLYFNRCRKPSTINVTRSKKTQHIVQCTYGVMPVHVPQVENFKNAVFVILMSKNLSTDFCHRLRRVSISFKGEISYHFNLPS